MVHSVVLMQSGGLHDKRMHLWISHMLFQLQILLLQLSIGFPIPSKVAAVQQCNLPSYKHHALLKLYGNAFVCADQGYTMQIQLTQGDPCSIVTAV
jgi:hypothetical protein